MRVIIYGMGAIGGVVAACLAREGREIIGIARGKMLDAIRKDGLTLISTFGTENHKIKCVANPSEIDWRPDDIVLLTMKTNDTGAALAELRASGIHQQVIACTQNGVANEPMALRLFPNVFGVLVMMPAQFTEPGIVVASGAPKLGIFDVGRFPSGNDAMTEILCNALRTETIHCTATANIMNGKYGKLLLNLGNAITVALGPKARNGSWYDRARKEAEAVYKAANITHYTVDLDDPRRDMMKRVDIEGVKSVGTSSAQSIVRGTGSIETEFLNGEIAYLGRLHGVKTPVNAALTRTAEIMVREKMALGTFREQDLERLVAEA